MSEPEMGFDLFIGVGHPFRRDDGVGPWLAEHLSKGGRNAVVEAGDGTGLIPHFMTEGDILVVDAMQSGRQPGTAIWLNARATGLPRDEFRNSTHEFGLVYAVETARELGLLPGSLWVIGIEGLDFGFGEGLSEPVGKAAAEILPKLRPLVRQARMSG